MTGPLWLAAINGSGRLLPACDNPQEIIGAVAILSRCALLAAPERMHAGDGDSARGTGASMRVRLIGVAAAILLVAGLAPAAAADLQRAPVLKAPASTTGAFWMSAEALIWTAKGDRPPALVTTSPAGTPLPQAGVLGQPGTSVLFGDDEINDRFRAGARVRAGYWFDPQRSRGIEANVFVLDRSRTDFTLASGGIPILAKPFINTDTGLQAAVLVAFPDLNSGTVAISETSQLFGAGAVYRAELCSTCA